MHGPPRRYFFTVVTHDRQAILVDEMERLRAALRRMKERHPVAIEAMVVLPDHLHTIWRLPDGDTDYAMRWVVVKRIFSTGLRSGAESPWRKREKGVWQRRFWEHSIRDDSDWRMHLDYIHYDPVKHGYCADPREWPYSSFGRLAANGLYPAGWGRARPTSLDQLAAPAGME